MTHIIKISDLAPGDVLLYQGVALISRAIQFLDGTDFSHAALYLGEGMVGEAVSAGLERRSYAAGSAGLWVQAHRLKESVPTMAPVLNVANAYLDQGNRYGYEQILLLAFLCLTRKLKVTPGLRALIRHTLDAAAALLTRLLSQHRQPMICSEFVFRSYDEALPAPNDPYSLWISSLVYSAAPSTRMPPPDARAFSTPPPSRGQGIHPQSLLALLSTSSADTWLGPPPAKSPPSREADPGALESAIETYLSEVQAPPGEHFAPGKGPAPTLEDLREATDHFAAQLYAAAHPGEPPSRAQDAPPAVLRETLLRAAADFVTPGDLYKTQSLFLLGKIETQGA
ncbi:MAG: hypothetical protein RBT75_06400 [Anaerolineae bacterium]|nr:hypothetical protein [Anaerolineae bacterium]